MCNKNIGLQKYEACEQLAVVLDSLCKDISKLLFIYRTISFGLCQALSRMQIMRDNSDFLIGL
jgi:hypothetical protein